MTENKNIEAFQKDTETLYISESPVQISTSEHKRYDESLSLKTSNSEGPYSRSTVSPFFLTALAANYINTPLMHPGLAVDFLRINLFAQKVACNNVVLFDQDLYFSCQFTKKTNYGRHEYFYIETYIHTDSTRHDQVLHISSQFQMRGWGGKPDQILSLEDFSPHIKGAEKSPAGSSVLLKSQSKEFCSVTQNQNPIHTSEDIAQNAGFPSIIFPMFFNSCYALEHSHAKMTEKQPEIFKKVSTFKYEFTRPILPEDNLQLDLYQKTTADSELENNLDVSLCLYNQDKTLLLNEAVLSFK